MSPVTSDRPFGRDVTVQNPHWALGSKPFCFIREVVAAARGRSPRVTYCQVDLLAIQVVGGSLHFADEENGPETLENFPRPSRQSVAERGLELSAPGGHAPALSRSAFLGAGTPEGSRPGDRLLAFSMRRGAVGGGWSRRTAVAVGPASPPPPCELCGHLAPHSAGPRDAWGPQLGLFAHHAFPPGLRSVCELPSLSELSVCHLRGTSLSVF